jgi:hypothetical protein
MQDSAAAQDWTWETQEESGERERLEAGLRKLETELDDGASANVRDMSVGLAELDRQLQTIKRT